ncbi:MAG: class I SAM-dependent methyltransferase [Gammaproteobacteria bacterium]|nr:class I SAM-dependent methyltransferase [Gammaproteobacteria bacterium]
MSSRSIQLSDALYDYMLSVSLQETSLLQRLRLETAELPDARMQISPEQGQFMAMLVELMQARRIIEVGTFTGYSALCMAMAMPADGEMVCCDVETEWTDIAQKYWEEAGCRYLIDLRIAPAVETLDQLLLQKRQGHYDLVFIDADKGNYDAYYERAIQLVRRRGLIMIDNTLWGGSVIDGNNQKPDTLAIRALNLKLVQDSRVQVSMLPLGDGLTLILKK